MKLDFQLKEKSRANKIYVLVNYEGGDGDTEHPQEFVLPFAYDQYNTEENLEKIRVIKEEYKVLKEALDDYDADYHSVLEEYGENIAKLFDNAPNDPQTDYDTKCYLYNVELIGYDNEGNKYVSHLI